MRDQPLREMDQRRLAAELVIAEQTMRTHAQEHGRQWCRQRCGDIGWPCGPYDRARARFDAVNAEMDARRRRQRIADTRTEWR